MPIHPFLLFAFPRFAVIWVPAVRHMQYGEVLTFAVKGESTLRATTLTHFEGSPDGSAENGETSGGAPERTD